jgi:hypothetical protein
MTNTRNPTVRITLRAMLQRLNRALEEKRQVVRAPRGRGPHDGEYFILDTRRKVAVAANLSVRDLEEMAHEAGAIQPWEEVER